MFQLDSKKDVQVGSEDCDDVLFTGQRNRWMKDRQLGPSIEVSQERAIQELEDIPIEKNTKEDLHCTPTMHTMYRRLLGQINWLQNRTQFQCCHKFSRCASSAASPTIGDVEALNKLVRQLKLEPVKLHFWPLTGPLSIIGFLDASYRNNEDGSSRRGMTVFFEQNCESIPRRMECHMEVLLTTKVKRLREPYSQRPCKNCIHS